MDNIYSVIFVGYYNGVLAIQFVVLPTYLVKFSLHVRQLDYKYLSTKSVKTCIIRRFFFIFTILWRSKLPKNQFF